jgi:hypothetical protein
LADINNSIAVIKNPGIKKAMLPGFSGRQFSRMKYLYDRHPLSGEQPRQISI